MIAAGWVSDADHGAGLHFYKIEKKTDGYQIVPISSFDESIEVIDELGIKASELLSSFLKIRSRINYAKENGKDNLCG